MASPLAAFRKYQKVLLAVFGVALMLVFTVGSLVSEYLGASQAGAVENKVVVSWKDGEIRENGMQMHRFIRAQLRAFQQQVIAITQQRRGTPRLAVVPDSNSEASIVQSLLLAREAERLGVVVGDEAILRYLTDQLSDKTIDRNELARILSDSTGGRMTQLQLFDGLRGEMLARQVQMIALDSAISPGESFAYFKRLSRGMEAEIMPLAVADFMDQVKESPSAGEIQEIYDEYKEVYPSKVAPTPGLKRPKRAAFQWLKADFQDYLDREIAKVTDEQVLAYYEENKDSEYRVAELPATDLFDDEDPAADLSTPDSPIDTSPELDLVPADDSAVEPSEAEEDEVDPDATDATSDLSEKADGGSVESDTSDLDPPDSNSDVAEGGQGVDQFDEVETTDRSGPQGVETESGETDELKQPSEDSSPDSDTDDGQVAGFESPAAIESVATYRPLEEVKDEIKEKIARPLATTAQSSAIDSSQAVLRRYFGDHVSWDASEPAERGPEPVRPDFEKIAQEYGMVAGDIPLSRAIDIDEYELGRAFELDMNALQMGQLVQIPFAQIGYSESLARFQPKTIRAATSQSEFVFWKINSEEEFTPTLEQAKEDIIRYLKMKKALKLAEDKAKSLAKEVRDSGSSLRQVFGERDGFTVTDTNEFTWMSYGGAPSGQSVPRISAVEGAEYAGQQFMKDVSKLKSGETTVTVNYPEDTVYVVYMKAVMGDDSNLQSEFLIQGLSMPVLMMARQDNMMSASEWYTSLEDEWGVEWKRPPFTSR